jgi:enamine deaminase RidA (YjgF/YER057c/UK114 family)
MAAAIGLASPAAMARPGGHYSHAVIAGGLVFVAGQLPVAAEGRRLADAPFEEQAHQVLDNVAAALAGAGTAVARLVQVRVCVTDIGSWPAFDAIYAA